MRGLLAEVYIELSGGRQSAFTLQNAEVRMEQAAIEVVTERATILPPRISREEIDAHRSFVARLGERAFWLKTKTFGSGDGG